MFAAQKELFCRRPREHGRHNAKRKREEVRHDQVGTVLLPLVEDLDSLAFKRKHVVRGDDLHVGELLQEPDCVRTSGLKRVVRPVDLAQRQVSDLEHVASLCFAVMRILESVFALASMGMNGSTARRSFEQSPSPI